MQNFNNPQENHTFQNDENNKEVQQKDADNRISPFENRLPGLKQGEFSYVERVFTQKGHFGYFAPERIESPEDVAYIFNRLEDEAVENSFAVYIKNRQPVIQHLGMGNFNSAPVNIPAIIEGADRIKPDQVYFVHNHPSGNLAPSDADRKVYAVLKAVLKEKLQDGIIINLRSGKYGVFNEFKNHIGYKANRETPVPVGIFSFDKQVFDKNFNPEKIFRVSSSRDVAAFISGHRLGKRDKMNFLVLNRSLGIMGNFISGLTELTGKNVEKLARYIASRVNTHGGEAVITYGNARQEEAAVNLLKNFLGLREIKLLDAVFLQNNNLISYADNGVLAEKSCEYHSEANRSARDGDDLIWSYGRVHDDSGYRRFPGR